MKYTMILLNFQISDRALFLPLFLVKNFDYNRCLRTSENMVRYLCCVLQINSSILEFILGIDETNIPS